MLSLQAIRLVFRYVVFTAALIATLVFQNVYVYACVLGEIFVLFSFVVKGKKDLRVFLSGGKSREGRKEIGEQQ